MYSTATHSATQLGKVAKPGRYIAPLGKWAAYVDLSKVNHTIEDYRFNGDTYDTLNLMAKYAREQADDLRKLTDALQGNSLKDTLRNYWNWVYKHIAYVDDGKVEQVRTPLRTILDQKGDCDCMTTLLSSMMLSQSIKHALRKAKYVQDTGEVGDWQHVYAVVPVNQTTPDYNHVYVLDCVLDTFNEEHDHADKHDKEMRIQGLRNVPIQGLRNVPSTTLGIDGVKQGLERIVLMGAREPFFQSYIAPLSHLLRYWNTPVQRIQAARELSIVHAHPFYKALYNYLQALQLGTNLQQASNELLFTSPVAEYAVVAQGSFQGLGNIWDSLKNIDWQKTTQDISAVATTYQTITGSGNTTPSTAPSPQPTYTPTTYYPPVGSGTNTPSTNNTLLYVFGGVLTLAVVGGIIYAVTR